MMLRRHDDEAVTRTGTRLTTVYRSTLTAVFVVRHGEDERDPDDLFESIGTKVMLASVERCVLYRCYAQR